MTPINDDCNSEYWSKRRGITTDKLRGPTMDAPSCSPGQRSFGAVPGLIDPGPTARTATPNGRHPPRLAQAGRGGVLDFPGQFRGDSVEEIGPPVLGHDEGLQNSQNAILRSRPAIHPQAGPNLLVVEGKNWLRRGKGFQSAKNTTEISPTVK